MKSSINQEKISIQDTVELPSHHEKRYRWLILALLWLLYFSFGVATRSPSPLITPIIKDLNISYGQMGFVLGSWQMTYIVLAIMAGIIIDRWGIRKSLFMGVLVIGLSLILRAFSTGFVTFLIFVGLFGVGGPMISIGCPKTISYWFEGKERATAVGVYTTGVWVGGMTAMAATNSIVMPLVDYSWRLTFAFYGAMACFFAFLWLFLSKKANQESESAIFNPFQVSADLLRIPNVRIIFLCGLLAFGIGHGYYAWLPKILEMKGFSPKLAGYFSAIPFMASIPAVLIIPRSVPLHLRGKFIAILTTVTCLSILLVVATSLTPIIGLLLYGISYTCLMPLLVLVLMDTPQVASKYLGSATGIFFCVAEIGGFLGPLIVGFLVDITGAFIVGSIFLCFMGLIVIFLSVCIKNINLN